MDADQRAPGRWLVLAMLVIAGAAGSLAVLPAAIGLGLLPAPAGELAIGLGGLAAFVGGVLGGVKWVAAAWAVGHRLLTRHPASVIAAYPD